MKKSLLWMMGASIALASCSSDEPLNSVPDGTKVDVNFSALIPSGMDTRAYGDGTTAKDLYYAVYDKDGNFLFEEKTEFPQGSLHKDVQIQLVTGETYQIVFWAQAEANTAYSFNASDKTMTIDYDGILNNNEDLDAFYVAKTLQVQASDLNQTAELKRPMCQVNIATADSAAVVKSGKAFPTASSVTFTEVPNTLNLLDGTLGNSTSEVTFGSNNVPEGKITVADKDYDYLSMTYFLASAEGDVQTSVTMQVNNLTDGTRAYSNIPVKRNYKTNIVGNLLTSTTLWDVYIEPIFDGSYDLYRGNPVKWDGSTTEILPTGKITVDGKEMDLYSVDTPAQLAWLSANLDDSSNAYIRLENNFDLSGNEWTPLFPGSSSSSNTAGFKGVIDGNGKTIYGLTISTNKSNGYGFVSTLIGTDAALKNINFKDYSIVSGKSNVALAAVYVKNGATVENVTVGEGSISGSQYVAGVVSNIVNGGTVNECTSNATVTVTSRYAGGIVASANRSDDNEAIISNCVNNGKVSTNGSSSYLALGYVGGIVGTSSAAEVSGCTNNGEVSAVNNSNKSGTKVECVGGIVGQQVHGGNVKNCVNNANITSEASYATGGIVGWLRYFSSSFDSAKSYNVTEVSGCTNWGSILTTNNGGAGGIVGLIYNYGVIKSNNNYAEKITGKNFTSGIVGGQQSIDKVVAGWTNKVEVLDNNSSTSLDNMTGGCKDLFIYINNAGQVELSNNNVVAAPSRP